VGRSTVVRGLLALGIVTGGLVTTALPAGAVTVTGAGSVACSVGTTLTFSPPLTPGRGTVLGKGAKETITFSPTTIGSCGGTVTTGSVPTSGAPSKPIVVKAKANDVNKVNYGGGCLFFNSFALWIKHITLHWAVPSGKLAPTRIALSAGGLTSDGSGNLGFSLSGTGSGSFAGPATLGLFFDTASTMALQGCMSGTGTVSTLTVDPTQSSLSVG
jgi:hypothetical protein